MNDEQRAQLLDVLKLLESIDDSDAGKVFQRVASRKVVEVLGLPLDRAPLLNEKPGQCQPVYCPSQYAAAGSATE